MGVFLVRIQSECGKIRTRKTPTMDTFHGVYVWSVKNVIIKSNNYRQKTLKLIDRNYRIQLAKCNIQHKIIYGGENKLKRFRKGYYQFLKRTTYYMIAARLRLTHAK